MYKDKAFEWEKKISYKKGIAYSKADLADRPLVKIDKDRNNNDKEPAYLLKYQRAEEALELANELKDDYLSGIIYYHLAWFEKWWGSREKFKENTLKAIQHIEKLTGNEFKDGKPLYWINCAGCKGNEALLSVRGEGGYLVMADGSSVDVSRSRKELLMLKLQPHKE